MHSRIFQLGTEPITEDNYIDECTLVECTNMLEGFADYFDEDTDRADDIAWLVSCLNNKGLDIKHTVEEIPLDCAKGAYIKADKITFSYISLVEYLRRKMAKIQKALYDTASLNLLKKCEGNAFGRNLYKLKSEIDDKFGFYIWMDDCYYTLDEFLYSLVEPYNWKETFTFYVGATIDYHS